MYIEVIAQSAEEAVEAEKLGVDRLELVSNIAEGGLTPSFQLMSDVLANVSIPVQIMIRPHSRSYHYDDNTMEEILVSFRRAVSIGGSRFVFGALTDEQCVDEAVIQKVTDEFPKLDLTFHKAFDDVKEQLEAYNTLGKYPQIKRILTSGGAPNCSEGADQLKKLRDFSMKKSGPDILPGGGLHPENIASIHARVRANQYHFGRAVRERESYNGAFSKNALDVIYHHTK